MKMMLRNAGLLCALVCFGLYVVLIPALYAKPRSQVSVEMQVALPRFVQVLMSVGDRFLAANLAGFRALVVSTEQMTPDNYHVLALVQTDAAWLNPAHEDNYYIATAILPWNGEVAAAQYILKLATAARPFDSQPPFYYGANAVHFLKNAVEGGEWIRIAADRTTDEMEQIQLQQLAANVVSKGDDIEQSIRLHKLMAKGTRHKSFARFLEKRIARLENFLMISQAMTKYQEIFDSKPAQLQDLVDRAVLTSIPADPFGMKYVIDARGRPQAVDPAMADVPAPRKTQ